MFWNFGCHNHTITSNDSLLDISRNVHDLRLLAFAAAASYQATLTAALFGITLLKTVMQSHRDACVSTECPLMPWHGRSRTFWQQVVTNGWPCTTRMANRSKPSTSVGIPKRERSPWPTAAQVVKVLPWAPGIRCASSIGRHEEVSGKRPTCVTCLTSTPSRRSHGDETAQSWWSEDCVAALNFSRLFWSNRNLKSLDFSRCFNTSWICKTWLLFVLENC